MRRTATVSLLIGLLAAATTNAQDATRPAEPKQSAESKQPDDKTEKKPVTAETARSALDFTVTDIDGKEIALSKYRGKVVMIVNVASRCGLTPQYKDLQKLFDEHGDEGLAILAFPCNQFLNQEPGSNDEIKEFCETRFGIKFDLFSKIDVNGRSAHELYKFLTTKQDDDRLNGPIKWNFTKFLLDREGKVVERFEPRVKPTHPRVLDQVAQALKAKPDDAEKQAPKPERR